MGVIGTVPEMNSLPIPNFVGRKGKEEWLPAGEKRISWVKGCPKIAFPPLEKGGQGGFLRRISKPIPLFPPFSRGDFSPTNYLGISCKENKGEVQPWKGVLGSVA